MKRVLIVDRSQHTRDAVRPVLEQLSGLESVDEAASSTGCLDALARSATDVLLIDWGLPELVANRLLQSIRRTHPGLVIVALSSRPEDRRQALAAGADFFVCKGDAPEALLLAWQAIAEL